MVTALYKPETSKIIQKHVEDFEGFGMVRVKRVIDLQGRVVNVYKIKPNVPSLTTTPKK